jgi:hypothetical protein
MTGSDANPCRMKTERMILASEGWHLTWRDRMKFLDSKCAPLNPHRFFIAQPFLKRVVRLAVARFDNKPQA